MTYRDPKCVYVCDSPGNADVVANTLEHAGIRARVMDRATLGGLAPQVAAAGMLTGSTLIMLPVALLIDGPVSFALQPVTWGAIAYYAVIATAGAYLLYYRVLGMAGSGNLLLVTLIIPPVAIVLGAWLREESLDLRAYAGFALLALGLLVLNGRPRRGWRRAGRSA